MRVSYGILITYILFISLSCDSSFSISEVNIDNSNALRIKINFLSTNNISARIQYWTEKDTAAFLTDWDHSSREHTFTLQSLMENSNYSFKILCKGSDVNYTSENYSFSTIALPVSLPSIELEIPGSEAFQGLIHVKKTHEPGCHLLIDQKGIIRWYQQFDTTLFRPFSWTSEGNILSMINDDKFEEFNLGGDELYSLKKGQGDFNMLIHHEIIKDKNTNYIALTRNNTVFDLSSIGGLPNDTIKGDGIMVLNSRGEKVWEWDIFKFENPLEDHDILKTKEDWSHANSINLDTDGHYIVSFRHFNQIWKINSESGVVMWKLGKDGDFELDEDEHFYLQHAAHINSSGELMLFDNGGVKRKTSRALSFSIDEDKLKAEVSLDISLPDSLFSFKQGSAFLIENDKVLFCSSIKYRIVMTNFSGDVLWQSKSSHSFYRAEYIARPESFLY